jgi:hypothetical protein
MIFSLYNIVNRLVSHSDMLKISFRLILTEYFSEAFISWVTPIAFNLLFVVSFVAAAQLLHSFYVFLDPGTTSLPDAVVSVPEEVDSRVTVSKAMAASV